MSEIIRVQTVKGEEVVESHDYQPENVCFMYEDNDGVIVNKIRFQDVRVNEKHKIANWKYETLLQEIKNNYLQELSHVIPRKVLILVDDHWEPTDKTTKNSEKPSSLKKAGGLFKTIMGYDYVLTLKGYYLSKFKDCQVSAMILAQLLKINPTTGVVKNPDIDDVSPITATFGAEWLALSENISYPNVAEERVEFHELERADGQTSLFEKGEFEEEPSQEGEEEPN